MKIYIVVLVRRKSDEYTMISTYVYFWQSKFLHNLCLHNNIIVVTLLELKSRYICKQSFKVDATYQNNL